MMEQAELECAINERVTELAREMHRKEKEQFEQLQRNLQRLDCNQMKSESTLELERLRVENEQLKARLAESRERVVEFQQREISYKSLLPTTDVIERYQSALIQLNNELGNTRIKLRDCKSENIELAKAYASCKARFDIVEEEKNESIKKQEFAERRCDELMRIIRRQDVGIDIDQGRK